MNQQRSVGVVVGRFQLPQLHEGHRHLIDSVMHRCDETLILVGVCPGWTSRRNPMDFRTRSLMLAAAYPSARIREIADTSTNRGWSEDLDRIIREEFPEHAVTLYGSRDSFTKDYEGEFPFEVIEEIANVSATGIREALCQPHDHEEFRAGVIYAACQQNFPTSFQAVDIAILKGSQVLVGRKPGGTHWCFPGGFVDPADADLEAAALREAEEEAGSIVCSDIRYLCSKRINDFRYRDSEHKVMSAFFVATYAEGDPCAGDDLCEVRWQDMEGLEECLIASHRPLAEALITHMKQHVLQP